MIREIKSFFIQVYYFLFYHEIWEEREQKRRFGKMNPDKTFYVIRFDKTRFGLMTVWKFVLAHLEYAKKNGYVPIIDLKNYFSKMLQNPDDAGKENAWEYYFEQPDTGYALEEVYRSKHVILALKNVKLSEGVQMVQFPMEEEEFQFWSDIDALIPVKREVEEEAEKLREKLFPKGAKILGASMRFEYSFLQEIGRELVNGHPVQPGVDEFIRDIRIHMEEWGCTHCFLAIDDDHVLQVIRESLGEQCIYIDRWRRSYWEERRLGLDAANYYHDEAIRNSVSKRGIAYMTELLLLSRCDCFLAGKSSGNIFAYLKNGRRYEHVSIYEKGEIHV